MGMGYAANSVDVVAADTLAKLCPKEWAQLNDYLRNLRHPPAAEWREIDEGLWIGLAEAISFGDSERFEEALSSAAGETYAARHNEERGSPYELATRLWERLAAAFRRATRVGRQGLQLDIGYHDADNDGDRYDDDLVRGVYFPVDGVWQHSPAGKKFRDKIHRVGFVTFG